jgi:hypothetical protein
MARPQIDVRNPLLALPASRRIAALPEEARKALEALLQELSVDAGDKAEKSWQKKKGPMAAYWKAVSVYAKHAKRLCR